MVIKKQNKTKKNKKIKKSKTLKKLNCAPNPNNKKKYTCYSDNALIKMRNLWNSRHPDNKIKSKDTKHIWNNLKENLKDTCDIESCWLKQKFIENNLDNTLLNYTFAPKAPKEWKYNPTEWLSSLDIIKVMKQYEEFYKCFNFIGPSPINYDSHKEYGECVWRELCEFNLKEMLFNKKNKIGVIFNTDPDYKVGSHWISLFINIKNNKIYFFDSNGLPPHKQIKKFINETIKQGKNNNINFKYDYNKIQHQNTNSECGMYCLYFIIQMLNDEDFYKLTKERIPDEKVMSLREKYFNKIF
jgi:hypothetical protein